MNLYLLNLLANDCDEIKNGRDFPTDMIHSAQWIDTLCSWIFICVYF